MANHQRTCKWCGNALHMQRLAKTYCSNACKQSAYYYRRKAGSPVVTVADQVNIKNKPANTVTTDDVVTVSNIFNESEKTIEPLKSKDLMRNNLQNEEKTAQPSGQIMLMGMPVTRKSVTALLGSVPEEDQRELSIIIMETIIELFPDMAGLLGDGDIASNQSTVTDEGWYPETVLQDEDEDGYNNTATSWDGANDNENGADETDKTFDEEADRNNYDDRIPVITVTEAPSSLLQDEAAHPHSTHRREAPARSALKKSIGVTNAHQPVSRNKRNTIDPPDYLERFSSPFICRGMDVWEELSVTVPLFMEAYVIDYAYKADMQVQVGEPIVEGMTTVHLLFHRADHRRQISRLLDLVLEAAEGLLSESDFEGDGEFSTEAREGNDDTGDEGDIDYDPYDEETERQAQHITQQTGLQQYTTMAQNTIDIDMALQLLSITKAA